MRSFFFSIDPLFSLSLGPSVGWDVFGEHQSGFPMMLNFETVFEGGMVHVGGPGRGGGARREEGGKKRREDKAAAAEEEEEGSEGRGGGEGGDAGRVSCLPDHQPAPLVEAVHRGCVGRQGLCHRASKQGSWKERQCRSAWMDEQKEGISYTDSCENEWSC